MNRFLLLFAALFLAGQAQAYVILESKYRVELKPGVFEDQLVLKCDNGRKITVPWEARLSEACGEVDIPRPSAAAAAAPQDDPQERQKEILMSRVREQYGNVDERHVTVQSAQTGAEPHFSPQMREILKRYELCRKNTKSSPTCATERNQAMAALSAQPGGSEPAAGPSAAAEPQPSPKAKPAAKHKQAAAKPVTKPEPTPSEQVDAATAPMKPEAETTHVTTPPSPPAAAQAKPDAEPMHAATPPSPAAAPDAAPATDRVAREQKIAADYAMCMRAKPKFECESARAAAVKALDTPVKAKAKSNSAAKATPAPDVAAN
jgi:hypothetical protein